MGNCTSTRQWLLFFGLGSNQSCREEKSRGTPRKNQHAGCVSLETPGFGPAILDCRCCPCSYRTDQHFIRLIIGFLAMIMVGAAALAANVSCLWLLRKQRRGEVHVRASWIFTRTDALANLGTILGGDLVLAIRSALPDSIVGAAISLVVLHGSFEIIRDAASESVPELESSKSKAWETPSNVHTRPMKV